MQQPWRRTRQCTERRSVLALGDWLRALPALSLRSVRQRFLVGVVLD
jgi:hypothetical protein